MSTGTTIGAPIPVPDDPWSVEVKTGGQGDYELCPAGNYPGMIVALIDAGTHDANDPKSGKVYQRRFLILAVEIARKRANGSHFVLAERYTYSMATSSNFYALAVALTGPKREGEKFDPRTIVGMPVMVQVIHNKTTKNGAEKTYHNIGTIAQFPEGLPAITIENPVLTWSVMEGKPVPDMTWLPFVYGQTINLIIADSAEAKAGKIPAAAAANDDIPF